MTIHASTNLIMHPATKPYFNVCLVFIDHCCFSDQPILCCTYLYGVQGITIFLFFFFSKVRIYATAIPFVDTLHSKNGGNLSQILFLSSLSLFLFLVSTASTFHCPLLPFSISRCTKITKHSSPKPGECWTFSPRQFSRKYLVIVLS